MSYSNNLVLLILLALAILIHPYFFAPKEGLPLEFIRWHIYAVNGLSKNTTLVLHCKSKDNDLGV
ncbi:hypothetical protein REPUB_Repub17cG0015100 [Reevesia pubescens]